MLNFLSLLGSIGSAEKATDAIAQSAYDAFSSVLGVVFPVIISFLVALMVILGVKIGITFAKAEDEEGKKKAKTQLINVIIGFLVAIVFVVICNVILTSGNVEKLFKINFKK